MLPRVDIIYSYGGADGSLIKAAQAAGAKGVVVAALGWGNVNPAMYETIKEAAAQGLVVAISTRVYNGRVLPHYGYIGGGKTLKDAGAVFCDNLSPQKARLLLMLGLQTVKDQAGLQALFDK